MLSAILCHAAADAGLARELRCFIELNCALPIVDEEGLIGPGCDLLNTAEHALSADYVLLLLSPDSVPEQWLRASWEPILVDGARKFGTQIAYVLLRPCKFPALFRRDVFFDLSERRLAGQRALKRWLQRRDPFFQAAIELPEPCASAEIAAEALERLECLLSDQPGVSPEVDRELALRFAHIHESDFEGVFWLNCGNRSRAGILGDTAQMLGLKLRGNLEQNASALQASCASRRLLFVFEHVAPSDMALVTFGGKASVMCVAQHSLPARSSLEETAALFSDWRRNSAACLGALGDVQSHLRDPSAYSGEPWEMAVSLGSAAFSFASQAGRLAEAYELLDLMTDAMRARGDPLAASRLEWERNWILEEWNEPIPARAALISPSQPVQLSLGFG